MVQHCDSASAPQTPPLPPPPPPPPPTTPPPMTSPPSPPLQQWDLASALPMTSQPSPPLQQWGLESAPPMTSPPTTSHPMQWNLRWGPPPPPTTPPPLHLRLHSTPPSMATTSSRFFFNGQGWFECLGGSCGRFCYTTIRDAAGHLHRKNSKWGKWLRRQIAPLGVEPQHFLEQIAPRLDQWLVWRFVRDSFSEPRVHNEHRCIVYDFVAPGPKAGAGAETFWHGCYFHTVWNISQEGFRSSQSSAEGQDFSTPGLYVTQNFQYAKNTYAPATNLFGDGMLFRAVWEVSACRSCAKAQKRKGSQYDEVVFDPEDVEIKRLWVEVDAGAARDDPRFFAWFSPLEVCPTRFLGVTPGDFDLPPLRHFSGVNACECVGVCGCSTRLNRVL